LEPARDSGLKMQQQQHEEVPAATETKHPYQFKPFARARIVSRTPSAVTEEDEETIAQLLACPSQHRGAKPSKKQAGNEKPKAKAKTKAKQTTPKKAEKPKGKQAATAKAHAKSKPKAAAAAKTTAPAAKTTAPAAKTTGTAAKTTGTAAKAAAADRKTLKRRATSYAYHTTLSGLLKQGQHIEQAKEAARAAYKEAAIKFDSEHCK
jgi:hypothetical protein